MHNSLRKDRLLSAQNYALYYGYGRVDELSLFDVAIVEPKGQTKLELEMLREQNTLVFTYLSMLEVHPTEPIFKELEEEDFLLVKGEPAVNHAFGTYIVSMQSKKWIDYLLKTTKKHFEIFCADGLFLDTIGDLEYDFISEEIRKRQMDALINFLAILKMLYPKHLLIQNNGLEKVCLKTGEYIDGVCWENPPLSLANSKEWNESMLIRLSFLQSKHKLKVFLLLEESTEKERKAYSHAKKVSKQNNFLLYNAPHKYVSGVNLIKG